MDRYSQQVNKESTHASKYKKKLVPNGTVTRTKASIEDTRKIQLEYISNYNKFIDMHSI